MVNRRVFIREEGPDLDRLEQEYQDQLLIRECAAPVLELGILLPDGWYLPDNWDCDELYNWRNEEEM